MRGERGAGVMMGVVEEGVGMLVEMSSVVWLVGVAVGTIHCGRAVLFVTFSV